MRIPDTWVRWYSIISLFMVIIGIIISIWYQSLTNPFNILLIIFFIIGLISLTYETNRIRISHLPLKLSWVHLEEEDEYALSPLSESEDHGVLRIILERSGYINIFLREIIINSPNYFKMQVKEGYNLPKNRIQKINQCDRIIYRIPMEKELRKDWFIGIDFRADKDRGSNIYSEEIDITVNYDWKIIYRNVGFTNIIKI